MTERFQTLFIIADSGTAIRNILRTDVFRVLKGRDALRLVIFSPIHDAEFRKEVESESVLVEPLPIRRLPRMVRLIRSLRHDLWAGEVNLMRVREKRSHNKGPLMRLLWAAPLNRHRLMRRLERLEWKLMPPIAPDILDRYKPDAIFYTTLFARSQWIEIGAQQRGIPSIAFIMSWDNPTTKGPFPLCPDKVLVWNEVMRQEILDYQKIEAERVIATGVPQFDIYFDRSKFRAKEAFFAKWNLDSTRKLITYTTGTEGMVPLDHENVEALHAELMRGAVRQPWQLLVRPHPKDRLEKYRGFESLPHLVLQSPGRSAKVEDSWNPTEEDMYGLAELMCYSDVVVNVASTTTIDAAAFDTPVVNVAFDGHKKRPYEESYERYYDFDHYRKIVETGGVRIGRDVPELVRHIQAYLDDPTLDREGRERIRREQCWKLDGQSGRRIAQAVLATLDEQRAAHKAA
jgi:hypothetical protein